jgi:uncharacterized protein (TIGR02300 family)
MSFQNVATRSPQLGSKRVCVSCSTRFYDMTKAPPVCPKCGTVQPPEAPRVRGPIREPRRPVRAPVPAAVEAEEEDVPLVEADEDDALEEAEDVDEDDDTPGVVREPEHDV